MAQHKTALYARRFARNKLALIGVVGFLILVFASIFGPYISKWSYEEPDFLHLASAPSAEHWFGTSDSGNDLFAQTIHGLGRSLIIAVTVSLGVSILSALIGCVAALLGGIAEWSQIGRASCRERV